MRLKPKTFLGVSLFAAMIALSACEDKAVEDAMINAAGTILTTSASPDATTKQSYDLRDQVLSSSRRSGDKDLERKLNDMVERIAIANNLDDYQWQVYLLADPAPNAFTPGGGVIFVNEGFIPLAETESDMAMVLAHEMAHVTEAHVVQTQRGAVILDVARKGLGSILQTQGLSANEYANLGEKLVSSAAFSQFSQSQESTADDIGFKYYVVSGYRPLNAYRVFDNLNEAVGSQPALLNAVVGSHPRPVARSEELKQRARQSRNPRGGIEDSPEWRRLTQKYR